MKILIVDDSIFSQKITSNTIKKFLPQSEIFFANDGKQGFEQYKKLNPNYVLIDLLMPRINGQDLIKLIKEYDKNAKIIVVSADVQKAIKDEIESYGVKYFFNKPFNEEKAKPLCEMMEKNYYE